MKKLDLVLLIDDDIDDNFFHRRVIEKANITKHIIECLDGQEALEFLNQTGKFRGEENQYPAPDIIFLDVNMPKVNGWEFLEEYEKMSEEKKGGPIVAMLTTSLNPGDLERAKKYDLVKDFKNKPLTIEMLEDIMNKHFA